MKPFSELLNRSNYNSKSTQQSSPQTVKSNSFDQILEELKNISLGLPQSNRSPMISRNG